MPSKLVLKEGELGVIGLGHWGLALSNHLAVKGYPVLAWTKESEIVDSINQEGQHPKFLSDVKLSKKLQATTVLEDLQNCKYLIVALPSHALAAVLSEFKTKQAVHFISATKGLEAKTLKTPIEIAGDLLGNLASTSVLSGPTFAKDIIVQKPAGIVLASDSIEQAQELAQLITSANLKVYTSDDVIGVEFGGISKNVIAIACGIADGLDLGDSARACILTRGLAEMTRIISAMGGKTETIMGLSGLGDLVLTATCDASRNRQAGLNLAKGLNPEEVRIAVGSTIEGFYSTDYLCQIANKLNIELPITFAIKEILEQDKPSIKFIQQQVVALLNRPLKKEY